MDCSWTGSSFPGVFLARILEWAATAYSRGSSGTPEIKAASLVSPALAGEFITTSTLWEAKHTCVGVQITVASLLVCK